ncbi:MAG: 2-amino-4-hydroxy-6-hydroxymethyldihydropteridine diphosphokinase [Desulfohalobiaceae bacterium]|nr:2-amino-4-hydroxy-6-hydroxymethyldihydropteridine diphosphokinase [Desulfohalobiaceae bacterium]
MNDPWVRQGEIAAFIGLGSNQGAVEANLSGAVSALSRLEGVKLASCSALYYTEPQGVRDQPWFGNQVVLLRCDYIVWGAKALLRRMLRLEQEMGRVRQRRWGQRTIDLDLLLFGEQEARDPELVLPHPRMRERAFVLVPLLEIEPEMHLPDGERLADCLGRLSYSLEGDLIRQKDTDSIVKRC